MKRFAIAMFASLIATGPVHASVVLHATRVIYPAAARDVSLQIENAGSLPVVVQTWLDRGDVNAGPDEAGLPIILNPPIFRLDPTRTQSLRMVYTRDPMPSDRETLFWLNVLEIPPTGASGGAGRDHLQMILRTRIKVFFRPATLVGKSRDAPGLVRWSIVQDEAGQPTLRLDNPTPYHVNLIHATITVSGRTLDVPGIAMLAPGEQKSLPVKGLDDATASIESCEYSFLDDFGVSVRGRASW